MRAAILLILVFILAACNGNATPTATVVVPTPTATIVPLPMQPGSTAGQPLPTSPFSQLDVTLQVALPGTIIPASDSTIQPVDSQPFQFDRILFTQTGGITGVNSRIEVFGDGRVLRDGVESRVTGETISSLAAMIDAFDFFRVGGQFMGQAAGADTFTYTITVSVAGSSRMIQSQDGYTPQSLFAIYDSIRALGQ